MFVLRQVDSVWPPAVRAAVAVAIPLVVLFAADRIALAAWAGFGAFTGLYARDEPYALRARTLAAVGAGLVAAVAVGTAVGAAGSLVLTSIVIGLLATLATLLCAAIRTGPPGALFLTF